MITYSKKRILQFYKTQHFYRRAFERAIHDELLEFVLRFYQDQKKQKVTIVFSIEFLKKKLIDDKKLHLVLVIANNELLITAYWCSNRDIKRILKRKNKTVRFIK